MSLWQDMILSASRGAGVLGPAARETRDFPLSKVSADGGLCNRIGRSDLYYTALGLSSLLATGEVLRPRDAMTRIAEYLTSFDAGGELDLIHLSCLARSWACIREMSGAAGLPPAESLFRAAFERSIPRWRSADGGFAQDHGAEHGTVYGCFLAVGAMQDYGLEIDGRDGIERCILACRSADGGFSNSPGESMGLAPAAAGAIQVLHSIRAAGEELTDSAKVAAKWLLESCFRGAGFVAHEFSPEPDLLSTAVSLHAIGLCGLELPDPPRLECRRFVMGLRDAGGGFRGAASDAISDCEYTFYGLLALGCLGDGTAP
jgi:prenyltransferase beta subunit